MTTTTAGKLPTWLERLPQRDGFACISEPRRYAFDEAGYDAFYSSDPANLVVGRGVAALAREEGGSFDGLALEVGCGTGLVSLGLAEQGAYPLTVITDPSPAFLRITQKKVRAHAIAEERLAYAVLMGEEIDRLPAGEFSLIVLRSALHHVLDVDKFIADAARALKPAGVLTFQEPCFEGYLLMGAMVGMLPMAAAAAGRELTAEHREQVRDFANAMSFYARRDLDKSKAEDKHLFRVDELMASGVACGLRVSFMANRTYDAWSCPRAERAGPERFTAFFRAYAKHCMGWGDDLIATFDACLTPHCRYVDEASAGGSGPYLHGVFVCRKE